MTSLTVERFNNRVIKNLENPKYNSRHLNNLGRTKDCQTPYRNPINHWRKVSTCGNCKTNEKIFTYNSKKYYKSGDSGYIKDGFLFYNGRKSDNYKLTNGKFVNVNEIENIIKKYVHSNFIIFGENNSYNSIICDKSIDNNIINIINNNLDSFLKIKNVIIISEEEMNKFLTPKMSIKRNQLISYINNDYNKNIK